MCETVTKEGNVGTGVELLGCEATLTANQVNPKPPKRAKRTCKSVPKF
jgi:hypothetical protein